jgi:dihydropyrimidinase
VFTPDVVATFIEESERTSYLDFAIHGFFLGNAETEESIPELLKMGILSFKFFMSSPRRGMLTTDAKLLTVMDQIAAGGGMVMIHAENGFAIDHLVDRHLAEGTVAPEYYLPSHPAYLEAEAAFRAVALARATGCPLYLVHLSSREVLRVLRDARAENPNVYGETCPHYLTLTNDELLRRGPLAKVAPPLRETEDVDAMWTAVADRTISVIGSDSTGYQRKHKNVGGLKPVPIDQNHPDVEFSGNIFEARYGLNTIEYMMPVVFREAVHRGRLSLNRFVEVFSENPAKLFGLYPRKGSIEVGADGDVVVWDPSAAATASATRQHGNADFATFEGFELLGIPVLTMQRGEIVMENGELVGRQGRSEFLARDRQATAYAPMGNPIS